MWYFFEQVLNIANMYNIHLRTGCFCNPGACQRHLSSSDDQLKINFEVTCIKTKGNLFYEIIPRYVNFFYRQKGHTCADNIDLIDGLPTGSVRVSLGYMSDKDDVDKLLNMIINCFVSTPILIKVPENWPAQSAALRSKFNAGGNTRTELPISIENGEIRKQNEIYKPIK